jgi:hypothetical protein
MTQKNESNLEQQKNDERDLDRNREASSLPGRPGGQQQEAQDIDNAKRQGGSNQASQQGGQSQGGQHQAGQNQPGQQGGQSSGQNQSGQKQSGQSGQPVPGGAR